MNQTEYKYVVLDDEAGAYLRCNDRQKAVEYVQDWRGIGLPLHIVEMSEVGNFLKNRTPNRD